MLLVDTKHRVSYITAKITLVTIFWSVRPDPSTTSIDSCSSDRLMFDFFLVILGLVASFYGLKIDENICNINFVLVCDGFSKRQ